MCCIKQCCYFKIEKSTEIRFQLHCLHVLIQPDILYVRILNNRLCLFIYVQANSKFVISTCQPPRFIKISIFDQYNEFNLWKLHKWKPIEEWSQLIFLFGCLIVLFFGLFVTHLQYLSSSLFGFLPSEFEEGTRNQVLNGNPPVRLQF